MNCKQWLVDKCGIPAKKVGMIVAYLEKECWIDNAQELSIRFRNDSKLLDQLKVPDMVKAAIRAALLKEQNTGSPACVSPSSNSVDVISNHEVRKAGCKTRSRGPLIDLNDKDGPKSSKRKRSASPGTAEVTVNALSQSLESGSLADQLGAMKCLRDFLQDGKLSSSRRASALSDCFHLNYRSPDDG
jgi:hypothetical protein